MYLTLNITDRSTLSHFTGKMTPFVVRVVTDENEGADAANPDDGLAANVSIWKGF